MKRTLLAALGMMVLCACAQSPSQVVQKVKYDFGMGEKPEGYVTGAEKVMASLGDVGAVELKRLNIENRHGDVKFQEESGLNGKFYKEVKQYESYYPLDAKAVTNAAEGDRGFLGYIDYSYCIYQSERFSTRPEAEAASADIRTDVQGRESYRYKFSSGGSWDGQKGERARD